MKKIVIALALFLGGCDQVILVTTRHVVVMPDEGLYQCERFTNYPQGTVTSNQVSRMIVDLVRSNEACYNSQQAIRQFLDQARERFGADRGNTPSTPR